MVPKKQKLKNTYKTLREVIQERNICCEDAKNKKIWIKRYDLRHPSKYVYRTLPPALHALRSMYNVHDFNQQTLYKYLPQNIQNTTIRV